MSNYFNPEDIQEMASLVVLTSTVMVDIEPYVVDIEELNLTVISDAYTDDGICYYRVSVGSEHDVFSELSDAILFIRDRVCAHYRINSYEALAYYGG